VRRNKRLEQRTTMLACLNESVLQRLGCAYPHCVNPAYIMVTQTRGRILYWCDVHAEWGWTTRKPPERECGS